MGAVSLFRLTEYLGPGALLAIAVVFMATPSRWFDWQPVAAVIGWGIAHWPKIAEDYSVLLSYNPPNAGRWVVFNLIAAALTIVWIVFGVGLLILLLARTRQPLPPFHASWMKHAFSVVATSFLLWWLAVFPTPFRGVSVSSSGYPLMAIGLVTAAIGWAVLQIFATNAILRFVKLVFGGNPRTTPGL